MADKNSNGDGRKSARADRAKKRDKDVLENGVGDDDSEVQKIPVESKTAKPRGAESDAESPSEDESTEAAAEKQDTQSEPQADPKERGKIWLATLFEKMNYDLSAEASFDGDNYVFDITGPDAEDLVGRSRQSPRLLSSIQTLLSEHLGKDARGKVVVDIGGFKQKRTSRLTSIADQLGKAVEASGRPLKIAGLNSFERRVIHQHLDDDTAVMTESVDHGIFRKLQVKPN